MATATLLNRRAWLAVWLQDRRRKRRAASAEPPVIPPLDNQRLWVRADDLSTLDAGDAVDLWPDASPLLNDLVPHWNYFDFEWPRPLMSDVTVNGHKTVFFGCPDGLLPDVELYPSHTALSTMNVLFSGSGPRTVYLVYQLVSDTTDWAEGQIGAQTCDICGSSPEFDGGPPPVGSWFSLQDRADFVNASPYLCGFFADASNTGPQEYAVPRVVVGSYDGALLSVWKNLTAGESVAHSLNTEPWGFIVGCPDAGFTFFIGHIAEILVYDVAHDATTRAAITTELMTKYGIS
jgi:hypothetical protein